MFSSILRSVSTERLTTRYPYRCHIIFAKHLYIILWAKLANTIPGKGSTYYQNGITADAITCYCLFHVNTIHAEIRWPFSSLYYKHDVYFISSYCINIFLEMFFFYLPLFFSLELVKFLLIFFEYAAKNTFQYIFAEIPKFKKHPRLLYFCDTFNWKKK